MNPASLWRPLRVPIFRNLLVADVISDIGTFMQNVGAAWLMVSLNAGPIYVALTQTASSLPFFLLALPAGSAGDIVDRRKLILFTEAWMVCVALALAILTIAGLMSPWLLLALTFALSAGDAFEEEAGLLTLLSVVALVMTFAFVRDPAQDKLLCQVGGRSLAGPDKEIPENQPDAAIRRRIVGVRDGSRG